MKWRKYLLLISSIIPIIIIVAFICINAKKNIIKAIVQNNLGIFYYPEGINDEPHQLPSICEIWNRVVEKNINEPVAPFKIKDSYPNRTIYEWYLDFDQVKIFNITNNSATIKCLDSSWVWSGQVKVFYKIQSKTNMSITDVVVNNIDMYFWINPKPDYAKQGIKNMYTIQDKSPKPLGDIVNIVYGNLKIDYVKLWKNVVEVKNFLVENNIINKDNIDKLSMWFSDSFATGSKSILLEALNKNEYIGNFRLNISDDKQTISMDPEYINFGEGKRKFIITSNEKYYHGRATLYFQYRNPTLNYL